MSLSWAELRPVFLIAALVDLVLLIVACAFGDGAQIAAFVLALLGTAISVCNCLGDSHCGNCSCAVPVVVTGVLWGIASIISTSATSCSSCLGSLKVLGVLAAVARTGAFLLATIVTGACCQGSSAAPAVGRVPQIVPEAPAVVVIAEPRPPPTRPAIVLQQDRVQAVVNYFAVMFVIDASGSMDGAKFQAVRGGVQALLMALSPADLVAAIVFNHDMVAKCPYQRVAVSQLNDTLASIRPDGGTAMYDAIAAGYTIASALKVHGPQLSGNARLVHQVIILTDGEDQNSRLSADHVKGMIRSLAADGAQVRLIGIQLSPAYRDRMRGFMAGPNCEFIDTRTENLFDAFQHVSLKLTRRTVVVTAV